MINGKEAFMSRFQRTKKRLVKKFPGAELTSTPSGFFIGQNGKNIIGEDYPDLAVTKTAWEAWKNLDTVEYWNRINERNKRKLKRDKSQVIVKDDNTPFQPQDYIEPQDGFILSDGCEFGEWTE
tara:strand:+ start:600 stop:971 length:372 start_codon:yes stop_codon:yes gene_type:complete